MRKRIRKKKHLGEFRQLGFSTDFGLRAGLSASELDRFVIDFIERAIEANGLVFCGGCSPDHGWSGVISRDHRYESTTDADKTAIQYWVERRPEVGSCRLSEFWDVWHGSDPFDKECRTTGGDEAPPRAPVSDGL